MNREVNRLPSHLETALWEYLSSGRHSNVPVPLATTYNVQPNMGLLMPNHDCLGDAGKAKVSISASNKNPEPPVFVTLKPTKDDVLFGRGKTLMDHPGNVKLRKLAKERKNLYQQFDTRSAGLVGRKLLHGVGTKQEIVDSIIQSVRGRFLRKHPSDESSWIEVSIEEARAKVSHILRHKRTQGEQGLIEEDRESSSLHEQTHGPKRRILIDSSQPRKRRAVVDHPLASQFKSSVVDASSGGPKFDLPSSLPMVSFEQSTPSLRLSDQLLRVPPVDQNLTNPAFSDSKRSLEDYLFYSSLFRPKWFG